MKKINLLLILFIITYTGELGAQPGTPDSDFDADGKITTDFNNEEDEIRSVKIQTDGKIIVAGTSFNGIDNDFALARYNSDGTPDNSFSIDGKVTTAVGTGNDRVLDLVIQSDGKIIAAGYASNSDDKDFALVRYNSDGTLDLSFDIDGKVVTNYNDVYDNIFSLLIQEDGKIIAAGATQNPVYSNFVILRYLSDGAIDTSFGENGIVVTTIGPKNCSIYSIIQQEDGKIVAAGCANNESNNEDFALARYDIDGNLDNTFSIDGIVTTTIGDKYEAANSITLQTDGKIVVAGYMQNEVTDNNFALARFNSDGTLDLGFNGNGKISEGINTYHDYATWVGIQQDQKILAAGYSSNESTKDFTIIRYNADGTIDSSFGSNGVVITDFAGEDDVIFEGAIQSNGRLVVAGYSTKDGKKDFAVARYITGLNISSSDFNSTKNSFLIFPNPVTSEAVLEYYLDSDEYITIWLVDMQGRNICKFLENKRKQAGRHEQIISLPDELPSGSYFLSVSSQKGMVNIRIVK